MEQLHFVGFTSDSEALMLSHREDASSGEFFVEIDDYLLAAIEQHDGEDDGAVVEEQAGPEPLPPPRPVARARPRPKSELSPRQIQARLRSGSSTADVADEAGVEEEWVLRFADPILAEQSRVVEQAQRLSFTKPRVGPSSQPLRTSVRWNLADQGALRDDEVFDAGWSAYNLQGARWVVRLSFVAKRRRKLAEWEVDLREGELTARNRVATDLGYVEPGRRRKRAHLESPALPGPPARAGRPGVKRATKTARPGRKKAVAKRDPARGRAGGAARRPVPAKAPQKSVRKQAAKGLAAKKAARRSPTKAVAPRAARTTTVKKVTKTSAPRKVAKRSAAKKATRRSPGKRASSKAPPAPLLEIERTSHLARPTGPSREATPTPERREVPHPPPLLIVSTPETHVDEPASPAGTEEGSRWPLPGRRR